MPAAVQIKVLQIAVISPDPAVAAELNAALEAQGHHAVSATPEAAPELLEAVPPPEVVLWHLNHASAASAAGVLAWLQQNPGLPMAFIAVTDADEPLARVEAWLKRGVMDFLTLPVPGTSLEPLAVRLSVLEHSLRRHRERAHGDAMAVQEVLRYEEVFQKAPEAALIVGSKDGLILEANAAAGHILGISRADLLQRYLSLVLPDLFDREDYDPQVLALSDTLRLTEVKHHRPDHVRRWLDVLVTRVAWPPGQALLIKFHDITVLKEREARRLHESRLDAACRVMAGTARELSDVLTSVRGNLELLTRQPASQAEMRELSGSARDACDRAVDLSKRLATLARTPSGGELRKRTMDLKTFLEKAVPFALLTGRAKPVLQVNDDLWPVEADEAALTDLLRHLTANADEAMPSGGTLFIDAVNVREGRRDDCEQASVRIRFRDQGHGIDPQHLPRIFDPWFTTHPGRDGMGLAMAAALTKAHGGHLQVESQPGQGTTFTLWLPVNIRLLLTATAPVPPPSDGTGQVLTPLLAKPAEAKARILFMDDDSGIRAVVQRILTSSGYDVYCTRDGREAIEAYRKAREFGAPFDLILVDLDVRGGMGGKECVARLKAEFPALKALLTTGYIDDELMETYRDHGFLGVIPKPFQLDRLVQSLGRLVGA
jgi:PAS domain S-box-containing protein